MWGIKQHGNFVGQYYRFGKIYKGLNYFQYHICFDVVLKVCILSQVWEIVANYTFFLAEYA